MLYGEVVKDMVKGRLIRVIIDYVAKKKGVEGVKNLLDKVNKKSLLFTSERDIIAGKNYPAEYLRRVIDSAIEVLNDKKLVRDMGSLFGESIEIKFEGLFGKYPPKKSVQKIVISMRKNLPIFHTGYRTLSKSTYWLMVSKMRKEHVYFVDGVMAKLFERHGGVSSVKKKVYGNRIEYTVKF